MKLYRLGLLAAVAVTALLAFAAGTASATEITSPTGTKYTGEVEATSTESNLTGSFVKVECSHSYIRGRIETQGTGVTARGKVSSLSFNECNYGKTVELSGELVFHGWNPGKWTLPGLRFKVHGSVGECVFALGEGTELGSVTEGNGAVFHISSAKIPRTGGNFLCGSSATWNGSYTVTSPSSLFID